ncbi:MAG TPA: response regulator [Candidatus Binataceae bacterium]|nr:response regulator [Candidatus Binataceae bacterium]
MGAMNGGYEATDSGTAKILVVDDRPDKLVAFESILQELQQEIFTAASGEEALKLLLEHEFAVILLDVNMPRLDGLETAALIRRRRKTAHTPIIFVTAYPDEMMTMQGYSLGAVDYIMSPVSPEILRSKVKVFVDLFCLTERAQRQANERIALAREQAARAAAEEASRRSTLLADATRLLFGSLDFWTTVHSLFSVVLPSLADFCSFTMLRDTEGFARTDLAWVAATGENALRSSVAVPAPLVSAVKVALVSRKPHFFSNDYSNLSEDEVGRTQTAEQCDGGSLCDFESQLPTLLTGAAFPLVARGRVVGVACFAQTSAARTFSASDALFLEDLASRAAIALDNAQLYRRLEDADRNKDHFLAMLGHELRNPLTPIRNAAELLRRDRLEPERLQWAQGVIQRQIEHLTRLVDDLLDVSRITRGKIELHLQALEVSEVVRAAVEISQPFIEARKHRFTVSMPCHPVWLNGDLSRISQVLGNLLDNAAKYTPESGTISLKAGVEQHQVVFRVADNGVGIPSKMLPNIFDAFAQGERPPSAVHGGLGIGLTLVRYLVDLHGGSVHAMSRGSGQGSEFVVKLPLLREEPPAASVSNEEHGQPKAHGLRVLVVDDNQDVADSLALWLEWSGFKVRIAYEGNEALRLALEFAPDAIVLDIGMPGMDGYEIARRLREQPNGEQLIIVAASGYGRKQDQERASKAGCDCHLTKPIDPPRLCETLIGLCSARRSSAPDIPN